MALRVESPLKASVWPGAILGSIAHAIFVARAPIMSHTQSWDGRNYNVQNTEGSRGTIAFGENNESFVGMFFLEESPRNPLQTRSSTAFDRKQLLRGLPSALDAVAGEATQYLLQEVRGVDMPVFTAAFWSVSDGDRILAAEPWDEVIQNGGILVNKQFSPITEAFDVWEEEFELTAPELDLLKSLFTRRIANPNISISLLPREKELLESTADELEGMAACKESLAEIGISLS